MTSGLTSIVALARAERARPKVLFSIGLAVRQEPAGFARISWDVRPWCDTTWHAYGEIVNGRGLTAVVAAERLAAIGPNVLPEPRPPRAWLQLLRQLVHFFALLLWAAGLLALVGGLPELGLAIFAVVLLNGVFAFVQEHRAERAGARLRKLVPRRVIVRRDGVEQEIDASRLVPGDLVVVTAGDRISADMRALAGARLLVDESVVTGESVAVEVGEGGDLPAGAFVVEGDGEAEVTATGARSSLGRVAELTRTIHRPRTPLARELERLVRAVGLIAVGVGGLFYAIMVLLGTPPSEGFFFAVGVTVALVPEGLLPTVSLALAVGAQRMAKRHALVRRLESVETLGSTTFICTDKTGTLTENRMNVIEVWTPEGIVHVDGAGYEPTATVAGSPVAIDAARHLAGAARRCSNGRATFDDGAWAPRGDPMEAAIDALARRLAASDDGAGPPVVAHFAFDPHRRRASVVTADAVEVKGAPDSVIPRCVAGTDGAEAALAAMSAAGERVLAVACRTLATPCATPGNADQAESDLTLLGLLGLVDPPRAGAAAALATCRRAGIKVAMITGDHPATAVAIADAVGLRLPDAPAITGADLPDDEEKLALLVDRDGIVISRVAPEDKLRVLRALQRRGHVVAMTGDGVNDGPALQEADIGVAMGRSGTDVAREAADLVLLDDDFATIVEAVRLGRATFVNARQFLTYHLTDNVAELTPFVVWAVSGGRFPLALGVLQILALDLGTDTLSAAALGAEPPRADVLDGPPVSGRLLDRRVAWRAFAVLGPVEAALGMLAFVLTMVAAGWWVGDPFPPASVLAVASGATFATVVLAQTANAFACRNAFQPAWSLSMTSNPHLIVGSGIELVVAMAMLFVPVAAEFLEHDVPNATGWAVALASMPVMLVVDAALKRVSGARAREQ